MYFSLHPTVHYLMFPEWLPSASGSTKILQKKCRVREAESLASWSSQSVWPYAILYEGASSACFHSISYTLTLKIYRRIFYTNRYLCKMCIKYFTHTHTHTHTHLQGCERNSEMFKIRILRILVKKDYIYLYICVCITESLYCISETNKTL